LVIQTVIVPPKASAIRCEGTHRYEEAGTYVWTLTLQMMAVICTRYGTVVAEAVPETPGDCNGDEVVSIGEVQQAINMFLQLQLHACGVDTNLDGSCSIGEIQVVINHFLG